MKDLPVPVSFCPETVAGDEEQAALSAMLSGGSQPKKSLAVIQGQWPTSQEIREINIPQSLAMPFFCRWL